MQKSWKKYLAAFVILSFAVVIGTVPVAAKKTKPVKTKKTKTKLANQRYTTNLAVADKKAKPMKLGKRTFQVRKSGCGYIKFTAPEDGKYTITVYGLKRNKKRSLPGKHYWFRIMTVDPVKPNTLVLNSVKTNGGTTNNLYFWWRNIKKGSKKYRYLKKRYGKIYLNAGETAYVYFCCNNKDSFKVKIKKS